ncbi:hypothetical protein BC832DRAFT_593796 [Gaertneriomyces semiglobifer]|nr:hypothetical protein BC832DRAFT_593796 [Gaertneriomyces semiglobifer]
MVFENSPEFIYTWLAINKIGGVAAFINTNLQNKALAHCLTISNCVMVMYHSTLAGNVQPVASSITINGQPLKTAVFGTQGQAGDITPEILAELSDVPIPSSLKPEISVTEPAILIYTSGTTGMPKAAIVSHARQYLGGCIFTAAYRKIARYYRIKEARFVEAIEEYLKRFHPTLSRGGGTHRSALTFSTATRLIKLDKDTEQPIRDAKDLCVQCGYDEAGELVGEVVPGDPRKDFRGYHNDSGSTSKKILRDVFKKGDMWFRTGDVLRLTRDGYWYFVVRIEAVQTFPDVLSSNVYGVAIVGHDGKAGMASLTVSDPSSFAITGLSQHLHNLLPKYAVPIFVRVLKGEMEETAKLKVIKRSAKTVGFDISKYDDQVWWRPGALGFPSSNDEFVPFTLDDLEALQTGADPKTRL